VVARRRVGVGVVTPPPPPPPEAGFNRCD